MVTKQRQLEWLAKHFDFDLQRINYVITSSTETGLIIGSGTSTAPESSAISTRRHIITRQEWQRERDKMQKQSAKPAQPAQPAQDNSWHERGELPPVGCECSAMCDGNWVTVEVLRHRVNNVGMNIAAVMNCASFNVFWATDFRPLRTEREKAIDKMANLIAKSVFGSAKCQAEKLYDAGYRKVNP